mmetsp:Transcript_23366/g.55541  ORF Transcript_23366/g.55541 Transcript_23366/m.55541 type:complete len:318 (+) Transcript_23366:414-1367(+)
MRLDRAQRHAGVFGNLQLRHAAEEAQRHDLSPHRVQAEQCLVQPAAFLGRSQQVLRPGLLTVQRLAELAELAAVPELAVAAAAAGGIDGARARHRHHPGTHIAAAGAKAWRLPPDLPEHILQHLLGAPDLAGDAQTQGIDLARQLLVQHRQCALVLVHHACDQQGQFFIGQRGRGRGRDGGRGGGVGCRRVVVGSQRLQQLTGSVALAVVPAIAADGSGVEGPRRGGAHVGLGAAGAPPGGRRGVARYPKPALMLGAAHRVRPPVPRARPSRPGRLARSPAGVTPAVRRPSAGRSEAGAGPARAGRPRSPGSAAAHA